MNLFWVIVNYTLKVNLKTPCFWENQRNSDFNKSFHFLKSFLFKDFLLLWFLDTTLLDSAGKYILKSTIPPERPRCFLRSYRLEFLEINQLKSKVQLYGCYYLISRFAAVRIWLHLSKTNNSFRGNLEKMGWIEAMLTVAYPYMDYLAEKGQWIETSSAIDSSRWRWMWLFFKKRLDNFNNRSLFLSLSLFICIASNYYFMSKQSKNAMI